MSDSETEVSAWRNTDLNRVSPPIINREPPMKRQHPPKDQSNEPDMKKSRTIEVKTTQKPSNQISDDCQPTTTITQPPMLLFKHFLNQQEADIVLEEAMKKYSEYKEAFACQQLLGFFESHKDEEWFREKYHPDCVEEGERKRLAEVERRRAVFMELLEGGGGLLGTPESVSVHVSQQEALVKLMDGVCILLEGGNMRDLRSLESGGGVRGLREKEKQETVEIRMGDKTVNNVLNRDNFDNSDSDVECTDDNKEKTRTKKPIVKKTNEENLVNIKAEIVPEALEDNDVDMEREKEEEPRPLNKNCSIFLRNIPASVFRSQIEELVKNTPGFMRLALQDAMPERNFHRRGWLTFDRNTDVKNIVWELQKTKFGDVELGAVINNDISQRVRPVSPLTNHRAVMRQDVKYAAKLVAKFDKRRNLWQADSGGNPLLRNITEHLVDEGSYEEESYLGGDINNDLAITGGGDPANIKMEEDKLLAEVLDKLILYLRIVHSYDYYVATEYTLEDNLPYKLGLMHARGCLLYPDQRFHQCEIERHMSETAAQTEVVLESIFNLCDKEVACRLGVKTVEEAVAKFMDDNCKELSSEKWLCPLSGKKFKGRDFVMKHILNKYSDRVENVKQTVQYYNNYVEDPRRPQLPEHESNRPPKQQQQLQQAGTIRGGQYRRSDHVADLRGGGRGSYYSRKIMNYNDVDN